jgi:hypothetical protein
MASTTRRAKKTAKKPSGKATAAKRKGRSSSSRKSSGTTSKRSVAERIARIKRFFARDRRATGASKAKIQAAGLKSEKAWPDSFHDFSKRTRPFSDFKDFANYVAWQDRKGKA